MSKHLALLLVHRKAGINEQGAFLVAVGSVYGKKTSTGTLHRAAGGYTTCRIDINIQE